MAHGRAQRTELRNAKGSGMKSIGEELPKQMARVRDHVLPHYVELGPVGMFGAAMIRGDLDRAAQALAEGDLVGMISAYEALRDTRG